MEGDNELSHVLSLPENDSSFKPVGRERCDQCRRPAKVCWCPSVARPRIECKTRIYILQHPAEHHRSIQTSLMLRSGLADGQCQIIRSRKFHRNLEEAKLLNSSNLLLLFPGPNAVPIHEIPKNESGYDLVLLDGTWREAKRMYNQNDVLKTMRMVSLPDRGQISDFIIRTQPKDECLSTVESAVLAISILENRPDIIEPLTRPLKLACQYQLEHGAVVHESKERKQAKLSANVSNGQ